MAFKIGIIKKLPMESVNNGRDKKIRYILYSRYKCI